jgi:rubrerythrin
MLIVLGFCVFMVCVYFTRWVFGIDQIIQNQKNQTELLNNISENIKKLVSLEMEEQITSKKSTAQNTNKMPENYEQKISSGKIMEDYRCPACQTPVGENDKECPNCGLVIRE